MLSLVHAMKAPSFPAMPALVLSNVAGAGGLPKAEAEGIATCALPHRDFASRADFDAALDAQLMAHDIDLVCLAGFMRIFTPGFVRRWEGRMLNIHPSLLPKYPGLNTHQRALDSGDHMAGCSVHQVIAELDAGPLLGQARVPIETGDSAETLAARVLVQEHILYSAVLQKFAQGDTSFTLIKP